MNFCLFFLWYMKFIGVLTVLTTTILYICVIDSDWFMTGSEMINNCIHLGLFGLNIFMVSDFLLKRP